MVAGLASTTNAAAQERGDQAQAQALFEQGSRLMTARRYDQACPVFEQAQHLVEGIGVTLYLAECYQQQGRLFSAWTEFDRARSLAAQKKDRRATLAGDRADRLLVRLPKLRINVDARADVEGLAITDDGASVERTAWYRARPAEARTHVIRVVAPAREPLELSIDVPSTPDTISVEVPPLKELSAPAPALPAPAAPPVVVQATPPTPAAPVLLSTTPPPSSMGPQRIGGFALIGLGAVGLGVGTVMGLEAKSKLGQSNSSGNCRPDDQCNPAGLAERSTALNDATISTVGLIGGAVVALGGAALVLTSPHGSEARVAVVPSAGPDGASLMVRGRW